MHINFFNVQKFFLSGKTFKIILNILIVFPGEKYAILSCFFFFFQGGGGEFINSLMVILG